MQKYVVLQVTLKEKLIGTSSKNLRDLEAETVFRLRWYLKELNKKN